MSEGRKEGRMGERGYGTFWCEGEESDSVCVLCLCFLVAAVER